MAHVESHLTKSDSPAYRNVVFSTIPSLATYCSVSTTYILNVKAHTETETLLPEILPCAPSHESHVTSNFNNDERNRSRRKILQNAMTMTRHTLGL
jgi:hypothetical protein